MRVHPALVPVHHPLASVRESFNAVVVEGDAVGQLMFYGRGAGGMPTASAVLGDLIDAASGGAFELSDAQLAGRQLDHEYAQIVLAAA